MEIRTYRAKSLQEALDLVRADLGADAAVLHTREVKSGGLFRMFNRARHIEVTASEGVDVPSRLPERVQRREQAHDRASLPAAGPVGFEASYRSQFRQTCTQLHRDNQASDLHSMVEELCRQKADRASEELPATLFHIFTDMIEADVDEAIARELIERVRSTAPAHDLSDSTLVRSRVAQLVEDQIITCGPIHVPPGSAPRLVALVGPTGVGKTTTIAKLAANHRLRQKLRVGLITVDTYRIAAVEQLRTYADIIDLPMEVVSTPREMREAVARMHDLDLVLMDTAGRSPRDEVRIQELKSMLAEADADEVHLVLSAVAGASNLAHTAEKFAEVGATGLILTKLDEATGLGNLLPLLSRSKLPLSYLTHGQNVPDDIAIAEKSRLAAMMLGIKE
jgi:flagellar biosynthesis protein FlhF